MRGFWTVSKEGRPPRVNSARFRAALAQLRSLRAQARGVTLGFVACPLARHQAAEWSRGEAKEQNMSKQQPKLLGQKPAHRIYASLAKAKPRTGRHRRRLAEQGRPGLQHHLRRAAVDRPHRDAGDHRAPRSKGRLRTSPPPAAPAAVCSLGAGAGRPLSSASALRSASFTMSSAKPTV
jgi:hypothetical protein